MNMIACIESRSPDLLDVVAVLSDRPDLGLSRGAFGTVIEFLDGATSLVEFSGDDGQAIAIAACPHRALRIVSEAQN